MEDRSAILPLSCQVQSSAWAKKGPDSLVAQIKGVNDPSVTYAELWMGAHPSKPSVIEAKSGPLSLQQYLAQDPNGLLGEKVAAKFGELPFLFKVLSIGAPLSIQAHPDKALAKELHAKDPSHYPDENHKPEIAIALTPLTVLAGFRPPAALKSTMDRYPSLSSLLSDEVKRALAEHEGFEAVPARIVKSVYRAFLLADSISFSAATEKLAKELRSQRAKSAEEEHFLRAFALFGPEDVGLASFFLLNLKVLAPGQSIFVGPGVPHAYVDGDVIECMATSDNVVRGGLTNKFQDREVLLSMLNYSATEPHIIHPSLLKVDGSHVRYSTPASEFVVDRFTQSNTVHEVSGESAEILILIGGSGELSSAHGTMRLGNGAVYFVPASASRYSLKIHSGALYRASVPLD